MTKTLLKSVVAAVAVLAATNVCADVFVDVGMHGTRVAADVAIADSVFVGSGPPFDSVWHGLSL